MVRRSSGNGYAGVDGYALRVIRFKAAQLAGRGAFTDCDREDVEQELMLDLLGRMPKHDPSRGAISTFVSRVVEHRVATLLEPRRAEKRDWRRNGASLHDEVEDGEGARVELWRTLSRDADHRRTGGSDGQAPGASDIRLDVRAAVDTLPPQLRDLCRWLLHYSVTEVSRATGIPRSTLHGRLKEIRARFEDAGLDAYARPGPAFSREHR